MECAWDCPACTYENEPEKTVCDMCKTARNWKPPKRPAVQIVEREISVHNVPGGMVREWTILDQGNDEELSALVKSHSTGTGICGYICSSVGLTTLSGAAEGFPYDKEYRRIELDAEGKLPEGSRLFSVLHRLFGPKAQAVKVNVARCMEYIQGDRRHYIAGSPVLSSDKKEGKGYLTAWVANYEISKCLRHFVHDRKAGRTCPNTHLAHFVDAVSLSKAAVCFLRRNQMPDLDEATYEERDLLLAEEAVFEGDPYILEFIYPSRRKLLRSDVADFTAECELRGVHREAILWMVDLKGHFNTAFTTRFVRGGVEEKTVVMLDSYSGLHSENKTPGEIHRLVFS
ncbi:hypothetical protein DIPPA_28123 [Diplonema papillatum]|nr:hypothetical protein DIPPA_28123 [Diplonema papillatum]|eukprot:gene6963-10717_t